VIKDALLDPDDPNKSAKMQTDANRYYIDSTEQDDATQSFRGAMDTEKGQAGQDSDNYKDFVAFQQGVIGVSATLTNLISKHY
jgi:hypothetical protein